MTPEELTELRQKIAAAKFQPQARSEQYAYQRGWNECLSFVERHLPPMDELSMEEA